MADAPSEDEWTGMLYVVMLAGALKKERAGEPLNNSQRDLLAQHREWEAEKSGDREEKEGAGRQKQVLCPHPLFVIYIV